MTKQLRIVLANVLETGLSPWSDDADEFIGDMMACGVPIDKIREQCREVDIAAKFVQDTLGRPFSCDAERNLDELLTSAESE
jgi:hypothetical protein